MIREVASVGLPVNETIHIKKNRLVPVNINGDEKRICIVTGVHGDELEGQYVCYEIIRRINEQIDLLKGIVDVYPAVNSLGIESVTRRIPTFDLDMNRNFPGNEEGDMSEYFAAKLVEDISGADICLDIHSSNIFIREIPQVRLSADNAQRLYKYAVLLNVDFIWIAESTTVAKSSFIHSMNELGVPSLAVEMGVGMRITQEYCEQLIDGIFYLMKDMGIWNGEVKKPKEPIVSTKGQVKKINAEASGIFIPKVSHWKGIKRGDVVGDIINPLTGLIEQHIIAPCEGMVFTLREYPVVYNGSLIARILGGVNS